MTGSSSADEIFELVRRHLSPRLALTARFAGHGAVEASADGCRVTLSDGRTALDFGSYAVTLLGHRHPDVVQAVRAQLDVMPTSTRALANPATARAAAALSAYLGGTLPRVYFGLNGADVVEAAAKLARLASGRHRILAAVGGYHGKSLGALALTHQHHFRHRLERFLPDVTHLAPDDPDAVARETVRGDVAAIVFEVVQGENGARAVPPEVLRAWCDAARAADVFVIADEIQTGLRRCGEPSLALAAGLPVDAVLVGKPLGGGVVPISALVAGERLYRPLHDDPFLHTATFGGHPLSCAAVPVALAAIERLAPRGDLITARLGAGLSRLRARYPEAITDVRGHGLLWGLDFATPRLAGEVLVELAGNGLLVSPCLGRPTTLRLLPPMICQDQDVDEALDLLDTALAAATGTAARDAATVGWR